MTEAEIEAMRLEVQLGKIGFEEGAISLEHREAMDRKNRNMINTVPKIPSSYCK